MSYVKLSSTLKLYDSGRVTYRKINFNGNRHDVVIGFWDGFEFYPSRVHIAQCPGVGIPLMLSMQAMAAHRLANG